MTKRHKAIAAVSACVLLWGFSFISIKIAVAVFPPMTLGALRFSLAIILLFFIKRIKAPGEKVRKEDIPLLACAGLTGVTLYFFFENNGVALIPASEASIITAAIPVITLIADRAGEKISSLRKKRVRLSAPEETAAEGAAGGYPAVQDEPLISGKSIELRKTILPAAGALISLAGVGLVAGVSFALSGTATGYLFMAGTCISWVTYCFLTRPLFARHSRYFIVFWQSLVGFIGFLPFALLEASRAAQGIYLPGMAMPGIHILGHVAFLGLCCSALGYLFYATALETLGASSSSLFINFIPVVSAIGGYFILGERLQPLQWLGAALVLAGVYMAMASPNNSV